jgi:hypothetical protein
MTKPATKVCLLPPQPCCTSALNKPAKRALTYDMNDLATTTLYLVEDFPSAQANYASDYFLKVAEMH